MEEIKRCNICTLELPLSEFYRDKNGRLGRKGTCKECEAGRRYPPLVKRGSSETRRQRFHRTWVRLGLPVKEIA